MSTQLARKGAGRPAVPYDPQIAEDICVELACSNAKLRDICATNPAWPGETTIRKWLNSNDEFAVMHARAMSQRAYHMAEEIIEIADNANGDATIAYNRDGTPYAKIDGEAIQRSKVRVDTRRWLMSTLCRHVFGDKLDVTSGGEPLPAPSPLVIDARVQTIMLAAASRRDADRLLED